MPNVLLNVPFITQRQIGAHVPGGSVRNDPTGCWYAAICMLAYYREAGPRLGVPSQYIKSDGRPQKTDKFGNTAALPMGANYAELMRNEGLKTVPLPKNKLWTCESLAQILQRNGPCYVRRGFVSKSGVLSGGHAIVLVGSRPSVNKVVIHDPARGPNKICSIDTFNGFFKWNDLRASRYSMMYKPPLVRKPSGGTRRSVAELRKIFGG